MRPSANALSMIIKRGRIVDTGAYDTVNWNHPRTDDTSAHVLGYRSYLLSMSVVFTLNYILGMNIFVFGGNKEHKNCALNVVDVEIFSWFE